MTTAAPDILLDADGDLPVLPTHAAGIDIVMQRVRIRLSTHRGDWPLDTAEGLPYVEWLAQKPVLVQTVGALLKREIEAVAGVAKVTDWSATQTGDALRFTATIWTKFGTVVVLVSPFGVDYNVSVGFTLSHRSRGIS